MFLQKESKMFQHTYKNARYYFLKRYRYSTVKFLLLIYLKKLNRNNSMKIG